MEYRINSGIAPGMSYRVNDKSRFQTPTVTGSTDSFTITVPVIADRGEPNRLYSNLSITKAIEIFGNIIFEKHGINSDIMLRWGLANGTVNVLRLEGEPDIANAVIQYKITEKPTTKVLVNTDKELVVGFDDTAPTAPFNKGVADVFLRNNRVTKNTFTTGVVKIDLPTLEIGSSYISIADAASKNKFLNEMQALIKKEESTTTVPVMTLHSRGGGRYGNKYAVVFGKGTETVSNVSLKDFTITYDGAERTQYKKTALVEGLLDEYGVNLGLEYKVNNDIGHGVPNINGNLDVSILKSDICTQRIDDEIFGYLSTTISFCEDAILTSDDEAEKKAYEIVANRLGALKELIMDGAIEATQLIRHDGQPSSLLQDIGIFGLIHSAVNETTGNTFNPVIEGEYLLRSGKDDLNHDLRRFDWNHKSRKSESVTIASRYIDFYQGKIDPYLFNWNIIRGNGMFLLECPNDVLAAACELVSYGEGKRYDWFLVTGNPAMNDASPDDIVSHKRSVSLVGTDFSVYYTGQSGMIEHPTMKKVYKVPVAYAMTEHLMRWYNGGRIGTVAHATLPVTMLMRNSVQPDVCRSADQDALTVESINYVYDRGGYYVLHGNEMSGDIGVGSRLKEFHNSINFKIYLQSTHVVLLDHLLRLTGGGNLGPIKEAMRDNADNFAIFFEGSPKTDVFYASEDDQKRGDVTIIHDLNMYGTVKRFNLIFNIHTETMTVSE